MPRCVIKLEHEGEVRYFEWSTVVDAPITYGLTLDELREHIREEYGNAGLRELPARLGRVEKTGTSSLGETVEDMIAYNRAGPDGSTITREEIWQRYVVERTTEEKDEDDPTAPQGEPARDPATYPEEEWPADCPPGCEVWCDADHIWRTRVSGFLLATQATDIRDAVVNAWNCVTDFGERPLKPGATVPQGVRLNVSGPPAAPRDVDLAYREEARDGWALRARIEDIAMTWETDDNSVTRACGGELKEALRRRDPAQATPQCTCASPDDPSALWAACAVHKPQAPPLSKLEHMLRNGWAAVHYVDDDGRLRTGLIERAPIEAAVVAQEDGEDAWGQTMVTLGVPWSFTADPAEALTHKLNSTAEIAYSAFVGDDDV